MRGDPPEPAVIVQGLGQGFGLAQVVEESPKVAKHDERSAQVEPEIDGLLAQVATVGEMPQGHERLLEVGHRLPIGRRAATLVPACRQ